MSCGCGQCRGIEDLFDIQRANKELTKYKEKGPAKSTKVLLEWIKSRSQLGLTLTDVGGGIGAIQHELFGAGVIDSAVQVDASSSYLQVSQEESERLGNAERVSYQFGNFVELAAEMEPTDLVTLDRVICCYHDMPAMINAAAAQSKKYVALVFPRDEWYTRLVGFIEKVTVPLRKSPFRFFIHSETALDQLLRSHGYERQMQKRYFFWQSMVYMRSDSAPAA